MAGCPSKTWIKSWQGGGVQTGPRRSLPQNLHRRCQFFVEAQIGPTLNPQSSNFVKDLSHDSLTNWSTEAASQQVKPSAVHLNKADLCAGRDSRTILAGMRDWHDAGILATCIL